MGIGGQGVAAHLGQQSVEAPLQIQPGAQHQQIDEQADQAFQFGARAVGHWCAHHDVFCTGVARQQADEGSVQGHEQGGIVAARQTAQFLVQDAREMEGQAGALVALHRRARPVGGQVQQGRRALQVLPPVGQAGRQPIAGQQAALPAGVVGVLDGQGRGFRAFALEPAVVQGLQLPAQHRQRPAVGDDVVDHQQQGVLVFAQAEQAGAQQQFLAEVEGPQGFLLQAFGQFRIGIGCLGTAQLDQRQFQFHSIAAQGHGGAVLFRKHRAQGGVAIDDVLQRFPQGVGIQRAGQAERQRDVVEGRSAFQPIQEPQPALFEGRLALLRGRRQRGDGGVVAGFGLRQQGGLAGRAGAFEQPCQGDVHLESVAQPRRQPHGKQGMAAQLEEVVVHADALAAQQFRPDAAEDFFRGRGRRRIVLRRFQPVGDGQGGAVQLAVGGDGQLVQEHEGGRHHVVRQQGFQGAAQLAGGQGAVPRRHIGHQLLAVSGRAGDHRALGHVGLGGDGLFDFRQFDAEAADFHLAVQAAEELDVAVRQEARPVAAAVQARTGPGVEGIGDETFLGQLRPVPITARHAVAAGEQFPGDADGHWVQPGIDDIDRAVGDGPADGYRPAGVVIGGDGIERGKRGVFGWTVTVHQPARRRPLQHPQHGLRRDRFAAGEHLLQLGEPSRRMLHHLVEQGGGQPQAGDALLFHQPADFFRRSQAGRCDHQSAAVEQRSPDFQGGGVESHRREQQENLVLVQPGMVGVLHQSHHVAVGGHDAFRPAGGAGGVHQVGQLLRPAGGFRRGDGGRGAQFGAVYRHDFGVVLRQALQQLVAAQQPGGAAVLQQVAQARRRVIGGQRHEGAAGFQHRQQGHHQFETALQEHRHRRFRRQPGV
ncbi:hypothetical protein MoryE10_15650 [Methylogaea oryzae]|uniref:Uncharacterized protein n=1 Tax=Methylogaea oryzae TaxID=1295382 RepID=A0A8D4VPG2_9GAMM|nr:hypothetical protein MoryE10_15650 [Methylogaea oryzae]